MHLARELPRLAMQAHAQVRRTRDERFQLTEIIDRELRGSVVLVGGRKMVCIAREQLQRDGFVVATEQGILESVGPGPHRSRDSFLDPRGIGAMLILRIGPNQQMQAREHRVRQLHLGFDRGAVEVLAHDGLDTLAYLRVVAIARDVDEAGVEAAEGIAPHEEAHLLALVEIDDAANDAHQVRDRGLEELIARIGLEHVQHRFAVVARRRDTEVR